MRYLLWAVLAIPTAVLAQTPAPLQQGQPVFATSGRETMPMMMIDEGVMNPSVFKQIPFPALYWGEEIVCLANVTGVAPGVIDRLVGAPPTILVAPAVRTIRVKTMAADSMMHADDSTYTGDHWDPPTIAEALVHSNFIIVTEPYQANGYVLRHEALHFLLWRLQLAPLGHPAKFFGPCADNFDPEKK